MLSLITPIGSFLIIIAGIDGVSIALVTDLPEAVEFITTRGRGLYLEWA